MKKTTLLKGLGFNQTQINRWRKKLNRAGVKLSNVLLVFPDKFDNKDYIVFAFNRFDEDSDTITEYSAYPVY